MDNFENCIKSQEELISVQQVVEKVTSYQTKKLEQNANVFKDLDSDHSCPNYTCIVIENLVTLEDSLDNGIKML